MSIGLIAALRNTKHSLRFMKLGGAVSLVGPVRPAMANLRFMHNLVQITVRAASDDAVDVLLRLLLGHLQQNNGRMPKLSQLQMSQLRMETPLLLA